MKYNWSIQQKHFETFTPILDFIHPVEHLHELSRWLRQDDREAAWELALQWVELCWRGDVAEVIGMLQAGQLEVGEPDKDTPDEDPRSKLSSMIGYLDNHVSRMDYPRYRQQGLPTTSCLIESQLKEQNRRVKSPRHGTRCSEIVAADRRDASFLTPRSQRIEV
ncbi:MAG: hypothetical protein AAGJ40_19385 [Planctomycetota bacterium]